MFMLFTVQKNLKQIQEEIAPYKPNIIAVTKYFDENAIIAAFEAGLRDFGESRVVEASEKIRRLPDYVRQNSRFHFIGHLQSNKAKKAIERFDLIHSVDSFRLASKISEYAAEIGKVQDVLLQLNNAGEVQKSGFLKEDLFKSFEEIKNLPNLKVCGLMNMAPLNASEAELKNLFSDVVQTKKDLEEIFGYEMRELSMGMSQDYIIAAREGATMLRIGRKLFS